MHAFLDETLEDICTYCKEPHGADLVKTFYLNFQYLSGTCTKCGEEVSIPTSF